uniref:G-protein coupled receptors family 1 profile domain-containing protein n=1 Tax=Labrus bergylta TaxID=56723 RepID=A0A3Q3L4Z7_9LABR
MDDGELPVKHSATFTISEDKLYRLLQFPHKTTYQVHIPERLGETLLQMVRKDHEAPIYVINLLISDLIQLCCMLIVETKLDQTIVYDIYSCGLWISVDFMVCVSLERYLIIAHPLWYRFKRTIKNSVVVSVVVWLIPPVFYLTVFPWFTFDVAGSIFAIFLILPFLLFIFFLVGTLRALSASVSVPSEEKQRVVGILVLVLLIYTLLFLPGTIWLIVRINKPYITLTDLSNIFVKLSPLADLILYVFYRKASIGKLFTTVNCCRVADTDTNISTV